MFRSAALLAAIGQGEDGARALLGAVGFVPVTPVVRGSVSQAAPRSREMRRGELLFIPRAITKQCRRIILSSHRESNAEGSSAKPKRAPWKFSQTLFYTLLYPRK